MWQNIIIIIINIYCQLQYKISIQLLFTNSQFNVHQFNVINNIEYKCKVVN